MIRVIVNATVTTEINVLDDMENQINTEETILKCIVTVNRDDIKMAANKTLRQALKGHRRNVRHKNQKVQTDQAHKPAVIRTKINLTAVNKKGLINKTSNAPLNSLKQRQA